MLLNLFTFFVMDAGIKTGTDAPFIIFNRIQLQYFNWIHHEKTCFFTFSGYILAFFIAVSAVLWGQFAPWGTDEPPLTVTEQNLGGGFMVFYFVSREPGRSYAVVSSQPGVSL